MKYFVAGASSFCLNNFSKKNFLSVEIVLQAKYFHYKLTLAIPNRWHPEAEGIGWEVERSLAECKVKLLLLPCKR